LIKNKRHTTRGISNGGFCISGHFHPRPWLRSGGFKLRLNPATAHTANR